MHLFLNALGASCASGLTYLRNVIPHFASSAGIQTTIVVNPKLRSEFAATPHVSFLDADPPASVARRFWFEQTELPRLIRQVRADVLISTGNFAVRNSPVPQILLSGNSLYMSADFSRDLRSRREFGLWLDHRAKSYFARRSVKWANVTVAPSHTFAAELQQWTGKHVVTFYHGFDHDVFFGDSSPLAESVRQKLESARDSLRLLFVSHYNYYRNFETLLRAVAIIRDHLAPRKIRLFLTCELRSEANPGRFRAEQAAELVEQLGIRDDVVELGAIPYSSLHHVYKACDLYVTPAYAETFAHPLVEAMASGLPVVASDLPVHREICDTAAVYFDRFSPEELSAQVVRLAESAELRRELSHSGWRRSHEFSWAKHVESLVSLARSISAATLASEPIECPSPAA